MRKGDEGRNNICLQVQQEFISQLKNMGHYNFTAYTNKSPILTNRQMFIYAQHR